MSGPTSQNPDPSAEQPPEAPEGAPQVDEQAEVAAEPDAAAAEGQHGGAVFEPPQAAVSRLASELEEAQDRHLRLAADFDNFRKRMTRERLETWARAQADVVAKLLDSIDDLGRVASVALDQATAADVLAGVALVERKLLKELEGAGLERIGSVGEPFDPHHHEAIGTLPAQSEADDHTVADVIQPGYRFGGALLRPARVRVHTWMSGD
jgi:molecular chaperone GrpE